MILPLRPNVCALLINSENLLFLAERYQESGHWQFPQGGSEGEYTPEQNVLRELSEELGVVPEKFQIIKQLKASNEYLWDNPPAYAIGKWAGQKQSFWLVRFLGEDSDINLIVNQQELMSWRWCTTAQVKELAHPMRLKGYLPALSEFEEWLLEKKS
jgi:putative (di)nucleoside polyphosphate hydrolase